MWKVMELRSPQQRQGKPETKHNIWNAKAKLYRQTGHQQIALHKDSIGMI
jgi:hypothetical protein